MVVMIDGKNYACAACIRGHRTGRCQHSNRTLLELRKPGRPVAQCASCQRRRKLDGYHGRCDHKDQVGQGSAERSAIATLRKRMTTGHTRRNSASSGDGSSEDDYYQDKRQRFQQPQEEDDDPWTSDDSDSPYIPSYAPASYQEAAQYHSPASSSGYSPGEKCRLPSFQELLNASEHYQHNGMSQPWSASSFNGSSSTLNEYASAPAPTSNPLQWLLQAAEVVGKHDCV